jgi:hypothetical protein
MNENNIFFRTRLNNYILQLARRIRHAAQEAYWAKEMGSIHSKFNISGYHHVASGKLTNNGLKITLFLVDHDYIESGHLGHDKPGRYLVFERPEGASPIETAIETVIRPTACEIVKLFYVIEDIYFRCSLFV